MAIERFIWDDGAGRYRDRATGRFITFQQLASALNVALRAAQRRIIRLAERLRSRAISVDEWALAMQNEIKTVHLYAGALARGGWGQLRELEIAQIQANLISQLDYFQRFEQQIRFGLPITSGSFMVRSYMYANAARGTYDMIQRHTQSERGYTEERNILHPADHCNGCLEASVMGWVPIGSLTPIGFRTCLSNCQCTIDYR